MATRTASCTRRCDKNFLTGPAGVLPATQSNQPILLEVYGGYRSDMTLSMLVSLSMTARWCENWSNDSLPWYAPMPDSPTPPNGSSGTGREEKKNEGDVQEVTIEREITMFSKTST